MKDLAVRDRLFDKQPFPLRDGKEKFLQFDFVPPGPGPDNTLGAVAEQDLQGEPFKGVFE